MPMLPHLDQISPSGTCSEIVRRVIRQAMSPEGQDTRSFDPKGNTSPEIPIMIYYKRNEIERLLSGETRTATINLLSFPREE
jgi:hypothetical protein